MSLANTMNRIYKPKYMDDGGAKAREQSKEKDKERTAADAFATSLQQEGIAANDKAVGRTRARSIWGRRKEKAVMT